MRHQTENQRRWNIKNPEKLKSYVAKYRAKPQCLENQRRWAKDHPLQIMLYRAKYSARRRGLAFNLTLEYLRSIVASVCPILGIPLIYGGSTRRKNRNAASLDQIVAGKGYIQGNVAIISDRANTIKNDGTAEEHRRIADWVDALSGDGQ